MLLELIVQEEADMVNLDKGVNIFFPRKLFVENGVADLAITADILAKLSGVPIEYVDDYREIRVNGDCVDSVYRESKRYLAIAQKKGDFVKEFRCMDGLVGKTEYFISHGNNCSFDCSYCFLQDYFENAVPTVFVNHDDILSSIENFIEDSTEKNLVFHAGELCDSFSFDFLTGFSKKLVNLFARFPKSRLEMRTKTIFIDNLLDIPGRDNIIVSWTFSPSEIIANYEAKASLLDERIDSAMKVQSAGYKIGICLDPIICIKGWLESYNNMLDKLFHRVDVERIAYVSLGGFRYLPSLATAIRERGGDSDLLSGEFVPGIDGKYRYFRPIRSEIYKEIGKVIKSKAPHVKINLCMETPDVWKDVAKEFAVCG